MTRFARAKGSKASNEKAPEDSTPWEVMKEQLLKAKIDSIDSKKRQEAENQRIQNYENFLKEQKIQKRKATWCDFPEEPMTINQINTQSTVEPPAKKKKKSKHKDRSKYSSETEVKQNHETQPNDIKNISSKQAEKQKHKKKKNKHKDSLNTGTEMDVETNQEPQPNDINNLELADKHKLKKKKKNKKHIIQVNEEVQPSDETKPSAEQNGNYSEHINKKKNKKAKKAVKSSQNPSKPTINEGQDSTFESAKEQSINKRKSDFMDKDKGQIKKENKIKALKKRKDKKLIDGQPVRRKEINDRSFQLIINGKDVELVRYDGFPIMKKDAERLDELKSSMMKKGIPKSEVQRTMKLERRRAEKALARLKRDVCYNCRKGGHNLSDCPELKSKIPGVGGAEGVCFKCGSTEHRQFECKVQRDKEFRFATCFICKEQGHIARQCPDNPKGLYPNGGCCKLCGDVTHLRKDCPTANDKKEGTSVKLQTLDSTDGIEDIGQMTKQNTSNSGMKKPKKIKF